MSRLKDLKKQKDELNDRISKLGNKLYKIKNEISKIISGVAVGEDINYKGEKYKITGFFSEDIPIGRRYKRNGELTKSRKFLWDYKKPTQ